MNRRLPFIPDMLFMALAYLLAALVVLVAVRTIDHRILNSISRPGTQWPVGD